MFLSLLVAFSASSLGARAVEAGNVRTYSSQNLPGSISACLVKRNAGASVMDGSDASQEVMARNGQGDVTMRFVITASATGSKIEVHQLFKGGHIIWGQCL